MIKVRNIILSIVAIAAMSALSCGGSDGGDDGPAPLTAEEQRLLDLGGSSGVTWVAISITQDGAPANGFEGFSLTMRGTETSKTYNSSNSDPLLNSSGTWAFNGTNLSQLIFDGDGDNVYAISNLQTTNTPATLTLTVNYTNPSGGAPAGQSGTYIFTLQAQ